MSTPPKRDKFAAIAAQQQDKQAQESAVPSSENPADNDSTTAPPPVHQQPSQTAASPPKRDKLAAMSASRSFSDDGEPSPLPIEPATTVPTLTTAVAAAVSRRDKFSAMASRQLDSPSITPPPPPTPPTSTATAVAAPRRDKFSAMAQRETTEAAKTATSTSTTSTTTDAVTTAVSISDQAPGITEQLQERRNQRAAIWKDLLQAEAATVKLLQTARQTVQHLAQACNNNNNNNNEKSSSNGSADKKDNNTSTTAASAGAVRQCMSDYQSLVQKVHSLVAPHAVYVRPYVASDSINQMYQARVELRLAQEKQELLQEFLRLEQQDESSNGGGDESGGAGAADAAVAVVDEESTKRKRDE